MSHGRIGARSGDQRSRTILAFTVPALPVFVRGNEHLDRLLSDPRIAAQ